MASQPSLNSPVPVASSASRSRRGHGCCKRRRRSRRSSRRSSLSHDAGEIPWHAMLVDDALDEAHSSLLGLTKAEATKLLKQNGPNVMTSSRGHPLLRMLWEQISSIITVILTVSAIIAGIFGDFVELGFIAAVIVANVLVGVIQQGRAEAATKAIAKMTTPTCVVLRSGRNDTVNAEELVVGDIVVLTAGDKVPADLRLVEANNIKAMEAALTGESVAVVKSTEPVADDAQLGDRTCMLYMGTLVFDGSAKGLVVATGDDAEIGQINRLMGSVKHGKTPLLAQIARFGFTLSVICICVAIFSFLIARFAREETTRDALEIAVGVAVALIPEGLPTVVTIALARGVQAMARSKAIVRQLAAVETLGALTCICSDKTGTLTKNEMTVVEVHTASETVLANGLGYNPYGTVYHSKQMLGEGGGHAAKHPTTESVIGTSNRKNGSTSAAAEEETNASVFGSRSRADAMTQMAETEATAPEGHQALSDDELIQFRQLLLPGVLCNDSTLMPEISRYSHIMMSNQPLTLPHLYCKRTSSSSSVRMALQASSMPERVEWDITGDPTEVALLALAMKAGINFRSIQELGRTCSRRAQLPFNSENKFMATLNDVPCTPSGGRRLVIMVKGAVDVLLSRCSRQAHGFDPWKSEPIDRDAWHRANEALAQRGMRVLALCQKEVPKDYFVETLTAEDVVARGDLQLNALVAITDPPREEVIDAISTCHEAGIMVKMITGDHAATAGTVGRWLGIETEEVLTGPQLQRMSEDELAEHVQSCNIFARTTAEHKLRIVRALQKKRHVVAMTGDGVNDGPALRQANVGVAMGASGTEVAREASRMILQDDNFATIEVAVKLGRMTHDNLRKLLIFLLPTSIAQGFSITVAVIIGVPSPLTHIQILFVNMITAATLGLVLASEGPEEGIMQRPPRNPKEQLLSGYLLLRSVYVGFLMIGAMLSQYQWSRGVGDSKEIANTMALNTLVLSQCLYCLSCRFLSKTSIGWQALIGNKWLLAMVILNVALQCLLTYTPGIQKVWETEDLDIIDWIRVVFFAVTIFFLVELEKQVAPSMGWLCCRRRKHQGSKSDAGEDEEASVGLQDVNELEFDVVSQSGNGTEGHHDDGGAAGEGGGPSVSGSGGAVDVTDGGGDIDLSSEIARRPSSHRRASDDAQGAGPETVKEATRPSSGERQRKIEGAVRDDTGVDTSQLLAAQSPEGAAVGEDPEHADQDLHVDLEPAAAQMHTSIV